MAEFQALLDFPPAPKLNVLWTARLAKATESRDSRRSALLRQGKLQPVHTAPYYTDNLMHDLTVERFYEPRMEGGMMITNQGAMTTFPFRGIRVATVSARWTFIDPRRHGGVFQSRCLELKLTAPEKKDLVAFMRVL